MNPLVDLPLLELTDDFHILFADRVMLEIVELSGVLAEIEHVDSTLVILIKVLDVFLDV